MEFYYTLFAVLFGMIALVGVAGIVCYVLFALGTMHVLKKLNYPTAWFAWIPIANTFALGQCCDEGDGKNHVFGLEVPNIVICLYPVISFLVSMIPVLGWLASLAVTFLCGGLVYTSIYAQMEGKTEKDCQVIGYLSSIIVFIPIVKFMIYRVNAKKAL